MPKESSDPGSSLVSDLLSKNITDLNSRQFRIRLQSKIF
jgi:hypothetical protein